MEENKELNFRIMVTSPDILEKEIKKVEKAKTTSKNINDENVIEDDFVIDKKGDFEYGR